MDAASCGIVCGLFISGIQVQNAGDVDKLYYEKYMMEIQGENGVRKQKAYAGHIKRNSRMENGFGE